MRARPATFEGHYYYYPRANMAIHRADGADPYLISTCARYETPTHTTRRVVRCLPRSVVFDWAAQSKRARKSVLRFPKKSNTTLIRVHRDGFRISNCFTRAQPENEAVEIYQGAAREGSYCRKRAGSLAHRQELWSRWTGCGKRLFLSSSEKCRWWVGALGARSGPRIGPRDKSRQVRWCSLNSLPDSAAHRRRWARAAAEPARLGHSP